MAEIIEEIKKYVKEEFEKPNAHYKEAYKEHFLPVVKYSLKLAEKRKADKEIVEIAAWLHDIGSIKGDPREHHILSSKIADDLLRSLNYPKEKIDKVKHCILAHRGSIPIKRETKEAQILADADALAHFDDIEGILKRVFKNDKAGTLLKLERSYAKLSDDAKILVKDKLEKARQELK